ncbi:trypsin-1-like [Coccinella septempunctata]|uniref:trypsin-1-like n=1 Tax=Coccinella septempunctata TaxID=41139 RepID=UPI001D072DFB|nr:trypsin-1-like [Coccinella septempunctata]
MNFWLTTFATFLFFYCTLGISIRPGSKIDDDRILINRPKPVLNDDEIINRDYVRRKRYLGLSKTYKLNRRYQECVAIGDAKGHCKHIDFCPMKVLSNAPNVLNYLCVIEKTHVGVCCPDDIALKGYEGSQIIQDLPGGGDDYENENTTGCGIPGDRRIVGEHPVQRASVPEWPWLAAIYMPGDPSGQQICGGSLITDQHILTASHCTEGLKEHEIRVRLGEYNFRTKNETRTADFAVKKIIMHEEFILASYTNDIAILKLDRPTSFNTYIWPICLPPRDLTYEGKNAVVAGWGRQSYEGELSPVLLEVTVPLWTHKECVDAFLEAVTENNICAAAYEGGKDSCTGDSGGPLNYRLENGRWVIIGIVSWGVGCAAKGSPGVYTKVANYLPWIIKNTIAE